MNEEVDIWSTKLFNKFLAGPADLRRDAGAWGTPPATLHLMRRLRSAFDPNNVINPGRFVV